MTENSKEIIIGDQKYICIPVNLAYSDFEKYYDGGDSKDKDSGDKSYGYILYDTEKNTYNAFSPVPDTKIEYICSNTLNLRKNCKHETNCDNVHGVIRVACEQKILSKLCENKDMKDVLVRSPLDQKDTCVLITSKKQEYYKFKYEPDISNYPLEMHGALRDVFDFSVYENCCRCIYITLYYKTGSKTSLTKYLMSIYRTIKNVQTKLKDWIVRVYLDGSVYSIISGENSQLFNDIMNSPIVEIYTYICDMRNLHSIDRTRAYRFMPFIDKTVSTCIVREADGIVSYTDCVNINNFCDNKNKNKIFYFLNCLKDTAIDKDTIDTVYRYQDYKTKYLSYSSWLIVYKMFSGKFEKKNTLCDMLAGCVGIKLKIKENKYYDHMDETKRFINSVSFNIDDKRIKEGTFIHYKLEKISDIKLILNIGYDEIFLLCLFENILSFPLGCSYESTIAIESVILYNGNTFFFNMTGIDDNMTITETHPINAKISESFLSILGKIRKLLAARKTEIEKMETKTEAEKKEKIEIEKNDILHTFDMYIDEFIIHLSNNNIDKGFDICIAHSVDFRSKAFPLYVSSLLNIPYTVDFYKKHTGYKNKYIKYKNKYLQIRQML